MAISTANAVNEIAASPGAAAVGQDAHAPGADLYVGGA